ncbi:Vacuolar protein sorting-associated protein [Coniochaeta hoffmannii]|uniref:Vacuolar protein sorting-associated protein n=1 Tax=Coniochaeta hoffmannii TaxID=91930 RepID=A0AA38SHG7_9PEZI|nr:Vacuolar protein sorting-associated protein [Coniochaeta hoffmannii]
MSHLRRLGTALALFLSIVTLLTILPGILNPAPPTKEERERDKRWVSTSPHWLDRQACRWLMVCGVLHVRWDGPTLPDNGRDGDDSGDLRRIDLRRRDAQQRPNAQAWTSKRGEAKRVTNTARDIPDYVLKFAPLVHLYSGEHFWPADIADFIRHIDPYSKGSAMNLTHTPLDLDNLGDVEESLEDEVFLTSEADVETRPAWLHSYQNSPVPFNDTTGSGRRGGHKAQESLTSPPVPLDKTTWWNVDKSHPIHRVSDPRKLSNRRRPLRPGPLSAREQQQRLLASTPMHKPDSEGYSRAPAVLILVDKGSGVLDAFWFFFYAYNLGQTVLDIRFGNHVADWEHAMVRFENGVPRAVFCSEHEGGKAYLWQALEKKSVKQHHHRGRGEYGREGEEEEEEVVVDRPVLYSAVGSHAMYADAGKHPYVLPFGLLKDVTDKGPLWDPALNTYAYFYDYEADAAGNRTDSLTPAASNPEAPTGWFHFAGPWGDELYPLADRRQWRLFGQYHYITGPLGPKFKKLDRRKVCQTERCSVVTSIEAGRRSAWY